jgi:hypothetical protein
VLLRDENSNYTRSISIFTHELKTTEVQKHTKMKARKVLAGPVFSCGSEAWTIRKWDEKRLTSEEMIFFFK